MLFWQAWGQIRSPNKFLTWVPQSQIEIEDIEFGLGLHMMHSVTLYIIISLALAARPRCARTGKIAIIGWKLHSYLIILTIYAANSEHLYYLTLNIKDLKKLSKGQQTDWWEVMPAELKFMIISIKIKDTF